MNIRAERFPRPPDKRETAAPAGNRHDGKIEKASPNNYNRPAPHAQGTPCSECRWYEVKRPNKREDRAVTWARRWSGCYMAPTRNPGVRCRYFLGGRP